MSIITDKQLSLIKQIEFEANITFRGINSHDAYHWINNHLHLLSNNSVTANQRAFISCIETTLDLKFEGNNKNDAKEWLSKYAPLYKEHSAKAIAIYLINNGYSINDLSYDTDGNIVLPKPMFSNTNIIEYSKYMGIGRNFGIIEQIEKFNDSCPSVSDYDNHLNYLTVSLISLI